MENIIYGVTSAINAYFKNVNIYDDTIKQGFSKPCFVVLPEKSHVRQMSIGGFLKTLTVKIIYHPKDASRQAEAEETAFKLCAAVKSVKWKGETYLGKDMRWEEKEGRLIFNVDFDMPLSWDPNYDPEGGNPYEEGVYMMNLGFNYTE